MSDLTHVSEPVAKVMRSLRLRASSMPIAWICAGSIRPADLRINLHNEAAATGTAFHKLVEPLVTVSQIDWDSVDDVCDDLGADSEECRMLLGKAQRMWPKIRDSFPAALTEIAVDKYIEVEGLRVTGHIDLISIASDIARIGDWKSGRKDHDCSQQMRSYMGMTLLSYPQLSSATATILWVRDGAAETYRMDQSGAHAWLDELVSRVIRWDGTYHPGEHCQFCPRSHDCPAANALMRSYVAAVQDVDVAQLAASLAKMEPSFVIDLHRKAQAVAKIAKQVHDAVRAAVLENGDIDDGTTKLTIETTKPRRLDLVKTWPVLEKMGFADDDFAAVATISPTKLDKHVAELAGKGAGAAAKRELAQKLELAGALEFEEVQRLETKRSA